MSFSSFNQFFSGLNSQDVIGLIEGVDFLLLYRKARPHSGLSFQHVRDLVEGVDFFPFLFRKVKLLQ